MIAVLILFSLPLIAQTDPARKTGVTFSIASTGGDVAFRRLLPNNWAVLGSAGYFEGSSSTSGGPALPTLEVKAWTLSAGARRYFTSDELRPFGEAMVGYQWNDFPGCPDATAPRGSIGGGVEYAVGRRVSIEGTAGLAYSRIDQRCTAFDGTEYRYEQDNLGTFRTALSVTFYF